MIHDEIEDDDRRSPPTMPGTTRGEPSRTEPVPGGGSKQGTRGKEEEREEDESDASGGRRELDEEKEDGSADALSDKRSNSSEHGAC